MEEESVRFVVHFHNELNIIRILQDIEKRKSKNMQVLIVVAIGNN